MKRVDLTPRRNLDVLAPNDRIVYIKPPPSRWDTCGSYKGEGLGYRGKPAERRAGVSLVGKQNTVTGYANG